MGKYANVSSRAKNLINSWIKSRWKDFLSTLRLRKKSSRSHFSCRMLHFHLSVAVLLLADDHDENWKFVAVKLALRYIFCIISLFLERLWRWYAFFRWASRRKVFFESFVKCLDISFIKLYLRKHYFQQHLFVHNSSTKMLFFKLFCRIL